MFAMLGFFSERTANGWNNDDSENDEWGSERDTWRGEKDSQKKSRSN